MVGRMTAGWLLASLEMALQAGFPSPFLVPIVALRETQTKLISTIRKPYRQNWVWSVKEFDLTDDNVIYWWNYHSPFTSTGEMWHTYTLYTLNILHGWDTALNPKSSITLAWWYVFFLKFIAITGGETCYLVAVCNAKINSRKSNIIIVQLF